jgi:hypothetical protein
MWVGGERHAPPVLPLEKTPYPLYRRLDGAPGSVWTGAENLDPTGIRSPDRPARSDSLYRLSNAGSQVMRCTCRHSNWLTTYRKFEPTSFELVCLVLGVPEKNN